MANTVRALGASQAAGRSAPERAAVLAQGAARGEVARLPPRWVVAILVIGYCTLIWGLVIGGAFAGIKWVATAFS